MLYENNFDLTQTCKNDGTINFRTITRQFNPIDLSNDQIVENDDGTYLIIKIGVDFVSTINIAQPPKFFLDGTAISFSIKNNISQINPVQGTVDILSNQNNENPAYVSSIFMSLQDIGKQLTIEVESAQSVLEAWMENETAKKLNNCIIDNNNGTYDGEFDNIKPLSINNFDKTSIVNISGADISNPTSRQVDIKLGKVSLNNDDTTYDYLSNKLSSNGTIIFNEENINNINKLKIDVSSEISSLLAPSNLDPNITYILTYKDGLYSYEEYNKVVRIFNYFGASNKLYPDITGQTPDDVVINSSSITKFSTNPLLQSYKLLFGNVLLLSLSLKATAGSVNALKISFKKEGILLGKTTQVFELSNSYELYSIPIMLTKDIDVNIGDILDIELQARDSNITMRVSDPINISLAYINIRV